MRKWDSGLSLLRSADIDAKGTQWREQGTHSLTWNWARLGCWGGKRLSVHFWRDRGAMLKLQIWRFVLKEHRQNNIHFPWALSINASNWPIWMKLVWCKIREKTNLQIECFGTIRLFYHQELLMIESSLRLSCCGPTNCFRSFSMHPKQPLKTRQPEMCFENNFLLEEN